MRLSTELASSHLILIPALLATLAIPAEAALKPAAEAEAWCGTSESLLEQTLAKHQLFERTERSRLRSHLGKASIGSALDVRKEGNVAVIVDDDGRIIRERNRVDLEDGFGMFFKYRKKQGGYLVRSGGRFNDTLGDKLDLGDDDSIEIDLPFRVKVYGKRYNSLFVNSDGNLTFGEGDSASTARDLTRVLEGPPRILPFFSDLNPETAPEDGGVFVSVGAKSVRITWVEVPEFSSDGLTTRRNTFQVTLARNGKATFVFGALQSQEGIIGLAPGGGSPVNLENYSEDLPLPVRQGAIVENFADTVTVDEAAVAQVFLERFQDQYEHLVVFTDFPIVLAGSPFTVAFELTVKNEIRGIGEPTYDFADEFGSKVLESFVMMGDVGKYGDDIESRSLINSVYSPVDVTLHEIGHRWGVKTVYRKDGEVRDDTLGRGAAHWSYCTDSENSYLEGNRWAPNGDGTYTSVEGDADFNTRDLYVMGLLPADEVTPSFVIADCNGDRAPAFGAGAAGERVDYGIEEMIAAMGERRPSFEDAPKKFKIAFVLLVKGGEEPSPRSIDRVDEFRKAVAARGKGFGANFQSALRD